MNIAIVNYEMGNLNSISGALRYLGIENIIISDQYEQLAKASKLILPGVGSFATAMKIIKEKKLDIYLNEIVLQNQKPILGICLGMQLMGLSSTENGKNEGLGFIQGEVTRFCNNHIKVPHVGFNQVQINPTLKLYDGMREKLDFYFTHSYKMESQTSINQCMCEYGEPFIASYELTNIAGVQFHPELSQTNGLDLLNNFIKNF